MIEIFADGCSLGNPGKSGIGIVIYEDKRKVKELCFYIGETTNNVAEYFALILSLAECLYKKYKTVDIYMDSKLIVEQVNGTFKVKNKNLYTLNFLAKYFISLLKKVNLHFTAREDNKLADSLAKKGAKKGAFTNKFFLPEIKGGIDSRLAAE